MAGQVFDPDLLRDLRLSAMVAGPKARDLYLDAADLIDRMDDAFDWIAQHDPQIVDEARKRFGIEVQP